MSTVASPARRTYRNVPEERLASLAERHGWRVSKRGWPDFLCFKDASGEVIAVEVKPRRASGQLKQLKKEQADVMDLLKRGGFRCFVSDGETLEPYDRARHGPP